VHAQPPYPPPYPQPQAAPPPPKRRGRKILIALGVVLGIVVVANAAGGEDASPSDTTAGNIGSSGAAAAGIGDQVQDGSLAFTVTAVETGVERLGNGVLASTPQGSYVLVSVTVTNIGDDAQMFSDSSQKLTDAQGREFDADSGAAVMSLPDSQAFLNNINPGNSVKGTLVYDVPDGLAPAAVELHGSMFSGGATVALTG
jgi:hypothetical protein